MWNCERSEGSAAAGELPGEGQQTGDRLRPTGVRTGPTGADWSPHRAGQSRPESAQVKTAGQLQERHTLTVPAVSKRRPGVQLNSVGKYKTRRETNMEYGH